MALVLKTLFNSYTHVIYELSGKFHYEVIILNISPAQTNFIDVRSREYPFSNSPLPIVAVGLTYLYIVLKLGPWIMRDRKPFKLDTFLVFYNAVQILCSGYVVKEVFEEFFFSNSLLLFSVFLLNISMLIYLQLLPFVFIKYKWTCEPIDFSNNPDAIKVLNTIWVYGMIKIVDLLDTVSPIVFTFLYQLFTKTSFLIGIFCST